MKKRIEYLDFIKGVLILWVVWFHTDGMPECLAIRVRMPFFFILSGIFFRHIIPFSEFVKKKINQLIIPFLGFLFISYLTKIVIAIILSSQSIQSIDFFSWLNIFEFSNNIDNALPVNVPLWFLISIFFIQLFSYGLTKLTSSSWVLMVISFFFMLVVGIRGQNVNLPLTLGVSLSYLFFYLFGNLYGKKIISLIEKDNWYLGIGSLALFVLTLMLKTDVFLIRESLYVLQTISFTIVFIAICRKIYQLPVLNKLSYWGMNSLIVLGIHKPLLYLIDPIIFNVPFISSTDYFGIYMMLPLMGLIQISILFINRFIPLLTGKLDVVNKIEDILVYTRIKRLFE